MLVAAMMIYLHLTAETSDPWKSPQLLALKERLAADPNNERLQRQIREADSRYRKKYRYRIRIDKSGAWLLLIGTLALAAAAKGAIDAAKSPEFAPIKFDPDEHARQLAVRSRWAVTGVGAGAGLAALWIALAAKEIPPEPPETAASPAPSLLDFQGNFPRFRGWDGSGVFSQSNAPLSWEFRNGAGIAWKSPIPAPGHSSPVVWSNYIFLTGGTAARREVFAYDTANGTLLWRRAIENVPGSTAPEVFEDTGYAASTAATDGHFVFAIFANGDLAALSFDGAVAWSKALGPLKNPYGHASSLAAWPGKLIVQLDQGDSGTGNSKLLALDPLTGRTLWERSRPVSASWTTPIVVEAGGRAEIFTAGNPWVMAYSAGDGMELWRAKLLEGEVAPSPEYAAGMLFVANPSAQLIALRTDGAGDVTRTAIVWTNEENAPDMASPVSNGELVFTVNSAGYLTCLEARSGAKIWSKDLDLAVEASPAIVGNRVFIAGLEGTFVVAEAARQFKELARSQLPDRFIATPAFANDRTILRGETNLYCIRP